jgi:hypothetical protein
MADASDVLRAMQADVIRHSHRAMRIVVISTFLAIAVTVIAVAVNPDTWWLAAVCGASLAMNAYALLQSRRALLLIDAGAVRTWMKPAAYAVGVAGVAVVLWALWLLTVAARAT